MTAAIVAAVVVLWVAAWPSRSAPATGFARPGAFSGAPSPGPSTSTARCPTARARGPRLPPPPPERVFSSSCSRITATARDNPSLRAMSSGVLCIDAVEISTNAGHYIALGLGAAPYRLGGEASAVVEDVRRLGGFGIVAHPDSPRPALAWRDWTRRRRRRRVAERRQRMAERVVAEPGPDAARLPCETRPGARLDARSGERHYRQMGRRHEPAPDGGVRGARRTRRSGPIEGGGWTPGPPAPAVVRGSRSAPSPCGR